MKHTYKIQKNHLAVTAWSIAAVFATIVSCLAAAGAAHAQTWNNVGSAGFSAAKAQYTSIAIDGSGTPYVVRITAIAKKLR